MIITQALGRAYGRRTAGRAATVDAVTGLDLDIGSGEIVALLGPNGAGKTTTVRMLATLLTPTTGTATVAGFDVVRQRREVRSRIGYISQAGGAGPEHRVLEELSSHAEMHGLRRREARLRAAEMIELFDLTGLEKRTARSLSGGQRRRLDVAMGVLHEPEVLFLDEPTTGLDPLSRSRLWKHLRDLHATRRCTVVLTTHYLDEADALCGRVVVLGRGRVIADDTPEVLKSQVSGDVVILETDQIGAAIRTLSEAVPAARLDTAPGAVRVQIADAHLFLAEILHRLDQAGISLGSVSVQRPTLEDVFLTLTGRDLDPEQVSLETADPRSAA